MIGIDIGSTQSGVAFAFLQNGGMTNSHLVTTLTPFLSRRTPDSSSCYSLARSGAGPPEQDSNFNMVP